MAPFSTASVSAMCASISSRGLSAASELENSTGANGEPPLPEVSTWLHHISTDATSIQELLPGCPAVSPALQSGLSQLLQMCEGALAVMDKQLRRLHSVDPEWTIDDDVVSAYTRYLELQARLFTSYKSIVQTDVDSQEASLSSAEIQQLVSATEQATGRVMQRASILRSSARPANAKSSTFGSPADPPIPASPLRPPSPAASSSESSKGKGFFSGLSESLQAMAAVMRPKPGPFVVPLCQAALRGDQPLIRRCLEEGANIDGRNEEGLTALICAINGGQHAAVQLLIKKGASVAARDSKGKTPLYRGTEVGDLRLISMLLQYGANVNDRSHTGKPFFVDAAINCDLQIVQLLLDHGADVNARDHTGRSVFILAVLAQNMPLIKLLAERGADVNARDITGRSALTLAILAGWMDLTKYLLDRGADSNCRDITGQPMLVHAVDKGNLELVKLLLWKGADPNAHDITGEVVFAMVIKKGNLQMARLFLAKGVDANQTLLNTGFGQTFLLHAIENEKWDLAALILKHGANSNATDRLGKVPLLEAMQKNNIRLVQLLLLKGADINQEGKITPLGLARASNRLEMVQLLQSRGAQGGVGDPFDEEEVDESEVAAVPTLRGDDDAPPDYNSLSHSTS